MSSNSDEKFQADVSLFLNMDYKTIATNQRFVIESLNFKVASLEQDLQHKSQDIQNIESIVEIQCNINTALLEEIETLKMDFYRQTVSYSLELIKQKEEYKVLVEKWSQKQLFYNKVCKSFKDIDMQNVQELYLRQVDKSSNNFFDKDGCKYVPQTRSKTITTIEDKSTKLSGRYIKGRRTQVYNIDNDSDSDTKISFEESKINFICSGYPEYGITADEHKDLCLAIKSGFNNFVRKMITMIVKEDILMFCSASGTLVKNVHRPAIPEHIKQKILEVWVKYADKTNYRVTKTIKDINGCLNRYILQLRKSEGLAIGDSSNARAKKYISEINQKYVLIRC